MFRRLVVTRPSSLMRSARHQETLASKKTTSSASDFVVPVADMRRYVIDCMAAVGAERENGAKVADLLILADVRGHYSHGLNRLRVYMEDCRGGNCNANAKPKILKQKGATAWVDGNNGLGAVVGHFCSDLAADLAKQYGVGWVTAKGSNHYGIAGYWPLLLQEQGLIGFSVTNTSPLVFPNRGAERAVGTNPISLVAPALNGDNFALDMATSAVALGKIELAERKGESMPSQWGADKYGHPTSDPVDVTQRDGALLPLGGVEETGGYKGTGLGMMVEVLSSILAGGQYGKNVRTWRDVDRIADLGQCFAAIDPSCFAPQFEERLQTYLEEMRGLKAVDAAKRVLIAGDPERAAIARSDRAGGIIYGQKQLEHLLDIARDNGVKPFDYAEYESN